MADPDIREIFLALSGTEAGLKLLAELAATPDGEEMSDRVLAEGDYQSRPKNLSVGADGFSISPKIYISGGARDREIPVETMEGPSSIKNSGVNVGGRMGAVLGFPDQSRLTASAGGHFYKGKNEFNEDLQRMWSVAPEEKFGSRGINLTDYDLKYNSGDDSIGVGFTPGVEGQKGSDWRVGLRKKWRF